MTEASTPITPAGVRLAPVRAPEPRQAVRVVPPLSRLGGLALDFLFPKTCVGCGEEGQLLCPKCIRSLTRLHPPVCPKCGRPQASGVLCPSCVTWDNAIDGIRAPFRFDGTMRDAIHHLKYRNLRILARPLAELMREFLERYPVQADVMVPVPLHSRRLRERGYNQSELLARELGRLISLPVHTDALCRTKYTPPQARTTSVEERRKNVTGSFACRGNSLRDLRVLLIDDVSTSATTLDTCASALKASGAASVWGLVLAREI
jgi:competence protein ComFC